MAARATAIVSLLTTLGFGVVLFQLDFGRVHPAVHTGFFLSLCVFLAALTTMLAQGARGDLARRVDDEGADDDGGVDRPRA